MNPATNEQLCIAARSGDTAARNALAENNLPYIQSTANEVWKGQRNLNMALGIEIDDLVQEGAMGLLASIDRFKPDTGNKFLTYVAPAIKNAMLDYIRSWLPTLEAKNLDNLIRLDELSREESRGKHEFIADTRIQNLEQIYLARETHEEIHTALRNIDLREWTYLSYRFGFEDDMEHPINETAQHFYLSVSRAKFTEATALDNVWLELPWWYQRKRTGILDKLPTLELRRKSQHKKGKK